MMRALKLGEQVRDKTLDNPWVGCVIVKNNKVIGEGHTHPPGGPHAEIDAINNAEKKGYSVCGSTLYSTVEPCSFKGRTFPCAEKIVEKKVAHVVISIKDPHPKVNGKGIKILREGGIKVTEGIEEKSVRNSLKKWLKNFK
tara:strand:+ start:3361 stop:3783 length:423 start_codon:yes stop_codon:yes gene_type:complete